MRLPSLRGFLAAVSLAGILACGGAGGTIDPAWAAYQVAAQKILGEYDLTMNDVATIDTALVDLGGGQPKITTDTAVQQLEAVVIPKLAKVAKSAGDLQTPDYPVLTEAHKPLVDGLNGKVTGYKQMIEAYKKRDSAAFDAALSILLKSDATVKRYRADFQRWSEDGRVTITAAAPVLPAVQAAPAPGVGLPGMGKASPGVGAP
jgi:hypothetical protein